MYIFAIKINLNNSHNILGVKTLGAILKFYGVGPFGFLYGVVYESFVD